MRSFIGFANYGVLTQEKQVVFTAGNPADSAVTSDKVKIELPEGFGCGHNSIQELIITAPNGIDYTASEILWSYGDKPVMIWYEGNDERRAECNYQKI